MYIIVERVAVTQRTTGSFFGPFATFKEASNLATDLYRSKGNEGPKAANGFQCPPTYGFTVELLDDKETALKRKGIEMSEHIGQWVDYELNDNEFISARAQARLDQGSYEVNSFAPFLEWNAYYYPKGANRQRVDMIVFTTMGAAMQACDDHAYNKYKIRIG